MVMRKPELLSQSQLEARRTDDDYRLAMAQKAVKNAARAVFVLRGNEVMDDPDKLRTRKLGLLENEELAAIEVIDSVKSNSSAAIRQINELGPREGMTSEQMAQIAEQEPAIRSTAEALSLQGLKGALREAVFQGDPVKGALWAKHAQAVLDRAQDAGQRIGPTDRPEIEGLIKSLSALGTTNDDRRPALRAPYVELAEQARVFEQTILDARKARGASTLNRGFTFRPERPVAYFPDSQPAKVNATGYVELNHLEGLE